MARRNLSIVIAIALAAWDTGSTQDAPTPGPITLQWEANYLMIRHAELPDRPIEIHYLEAYCRPGSTDRDWHETVIPHKTEALTESTEPCQEIRLRCTLEDGVTVDHIITAEADGVTFALTATNPTDKVSEAHWAQPCVRVDRFTGVERVIDSEEYLPQSFIFLDGEAARLPTDHWSTEALYIPGQVWCPAHVPRSDVNPRPLNDQVPSNGLIGCVSEDDAWLMATAWEPYQELFQGIITCLHSDLRIGGLAPGETKQIRGRLYLLKNNIDELLTRYAKDFPEHQSKP